MIGTTTARSGAADNDTSTATVAPSATLYAACANDTVTAGSSSSTIVTTVAATDPAVTPAGGDPNTSRTDSPSSSTTSWVAANVIVFDVSAAAKLTLAGTPE